MEFSDNESSDALEELNDVSSHRSSYTGDSQSQSSSYTGGSQSQRSRSSSYTGGSQSQRSRSSSYTGVRSQSQSRSSYSDSSFTDGSRSRATQSQSSSHHTDSVSGSMSRSSTRSLNNPPPPPPGASSGDLDNPSPSSFASRSSKAHSSRTGSDDDRGVMANLSPSSKSRSSRTPYSRTGGNGAFTENFSPSSRTRSSRTQLSRAGGAGGDIANQSPFSQSQSAGTPSSRAGDSFGNGGGVVENLSPSSRSRSSRTGTGSRSRATGRSSARSMNVPSPGAGSISMNSGSPAEAKAIPSPSANRSYSGRSGGPSQRRGPSQANGFASDSYPGTQSIEQKSASISRSSSNSSSSAQISDDEESSTMRQEESYRSKASSKRYDDGGKSEDGAISKHDDDDDDDSVSVSDEEESAYEVASRSTSLRVDPDPAERRQTRRQERRQQRRNNNDIHDKNSGCKSIAILGTMSDAGKSIITAGLCRILSDGGVRVAPFKAQNLSNNASPALLPDYQRRKALYEFFSHAEGTPRDSKKKHLLRPPKDHDAYGEIGTAQALQAEACRQIPRVEMNPVLLKSGGKDEKTGEYLCTVVVMGQQMVRETYQDLGNRTDALRRMVVDCHDALAEAIKAEAIVIEGAGSCTELNLMDRDIVNLPLVRAINCPWLLVANIDPGGVFAQIVGTKMCVSEQDWSQCVGIIVNKLRGDAKYFEPGPKMIQDMVGKPVFVVPFLDNLNLPEEDGMGIERRLAWESSGPTKSDKEKDKKMLPLVIVVAYPHTAISDDICPLERDARFHVQWRRRRIPRQTYPHVTAVILPGSKLTRLDLKWLNDSGWSDYIRKHAAAGGNVLGLCGGYQMLGWSVEDPLSVEGSAGSKQGLGLLPIDTTLAPAECKVVSPRKGKLLPSQVDVEGFELHCGQSRILEHVSGTRIKQHIHPLLTFEDGRPEGMCSGRVRGTYLHGILASPIARVELLIPENDGTFPELIKTATESKDPLDRFAEHLESCGLNFSTVISMMLNQSSNDYSTNEV